MSILEVIKTNKSVLGDELLALLKDEIDKYNSYEDEAQKIKIDVTKTYSNEEVLDVGMLVNKEVRQYVLDCEKQLKHSAKVYGQE